MTLDLKPEWLAQVMDHLQRHIPQYRVIAFGSRVTGRARPYSDLDLCVMTEAPLPWKILANLKDELTESPLPIKVDILDWSEVSEDFRPYILKQYIEIQKGA